MKVIPLAQGPIIHQSVVNLSQTFALTPAQHKLLDRGLSFIPSHLVKPHDRKGLSADLTQFHKRIQRAVFFENGSESKAIPFCEKSDWLPPPQRLPGEIWDFFEENHKSLQTSLTRAKAPTPNLTKEEIEALETLSKRQDIVIKPADKGNAVVIMDKPRYIQEGLRQLEDTEFYTRLAAPIFQDSIPKIEEIVANLLREGFICKKQANYLIGEHTPKPRRFYLLPKIHKPREKWPTPIMPPGRPIVSDCGSESYRIAELIDFYLNPLSTRHPSYIKDTYDFVEKVKSLIVPPKTILFSLDVDSLYTNIETPLGLQAIRHCFQTYPDETRPDDALLKLLELSLTKNDFEFGGKHFLQIKGTAMGKKFAPAYANIYMAQWEETVFPKCHRTPYCYLRYLDDIWGIWQHSMQEFEEFIQILNTHHKSIKIKSVTNPQSIDFLDTTVYKGQDFQSTNKLDLKVFFKETDTHALLHRNSHHPPHTYRGIIRAQLLRFARICTQDSEFQKARKTLFRALRSRGYPRSLLREIHKQHQEPTTNPNTNPANADQILAPTIFTYSTTSTLLARRIKHNYEETLATALERDTINILAAYKRNPNLRDLLVHSRLQNKPKKSRINPLGRQNLIKPWNSQEVFRRPNIPLNTKNCIYAITCTLCKKQYVGQTRNSIRSRLHQHRYTIRTGSLSNPRRTLIRHFQEHGIQKLRIQGIDHNPKWSTRQRLYKEHWWINKLNTKTPNGLNEREEL